MSVPRVVVAGLSGDVGKTTVSLGLIRAFTRQDMVVHPFKKGPDYIDTAWLALAARGKASNLDPFFLDEEALRLHFLRRSPGADLAVIEGNRGFFDGKDVEGSASTAEVARCLNAPVVLVVSIAKMTRTAAAVVAGCRNFPGGERIGGVILNHCAGRRHASIARRAVEELAGVPVFGVLPRLGRAPIYQRRSGLVTVAMHDAADEAIERTADVVCDHVDIEAVLYLARDVSSFADAPVVRNAGAAPTVRIGVVRDDALWQYYDENLAALSEAGADLVFLSLLRSAPWPDLDGLYLGGGDLAPHARTLAADTAKKNEVRSLIESGLPVYAEHSGYFYLGEQFSRGGTAHPMVGIFPVNVEVTEKPARLGYVEAVVDAHTPFYARGAAFKGHEYHYADIRVNRDAAACALRKQAGNARVDEPDGLVYKTVFGTSMQVFAPAVPEWAPGFVSAAAKWRK